MPKPPGRQSFKSLSASALSVPGLTSFLIVQNLDQTITVCTSFPARSHWRASAATSMREVPSERLQVSVDLRQSP